VSLRETLQGLVKRTRNEARRAEYESELQCPPLPAALEYLWTSFCRLHARRGGNGFSVSPISWGEIEVFTRLSGTRLAPWEVRMIEELDDLFRASLNTKD